LRLDRPHRQRCARRVESVRRVVPDVRLPARLHLAAGHGSAASQTPPEHLEGPASPPRRRRLVAQRRRSCGCGPTRGRRWCRSSASTWRSAASCALPTPSSPSTPDSAVQSTPEAISPPSNPRWKSLYPTMCSLDPTGKGAPAGQPHGGRTHRLRRPPPTSSTSIDLTHFPRFSWTICATRRIVCRSWLVLRGV
jgi:hypothetical protein